MAARTLDQILTELGSVYDPQVQSIQTRMNDIPNQVKQEEQGLQARQQTAFGDILNGARRRGTGVAFGGIPLQEQARYTADTYLPALANLRTASKQQALSLQDAINQINERRSTQAQSIFEGERNFAEQQRQFDAQLAEQRAARAASNALSPSFGGGSSSPAIAKPNTDPLQQDAYNDVYTRVTKMTPAQVKSDYAATAKSAGFGNLRDKFKLEFYHALRPDLFKTASPNVFANGSQLRY